MRCRLQMRLWSSVFDNEQHNYNAHLSHVHWNHGGPVDSWTFLRLSASRQTATSEVRDTSYHDERTSKATEKKEKSRGRFCEHEVWALVRIHSRG